mgnify:CR=1 FL=1
MPTTDLSVAAPAFINIAHRIVWATVATVDAGGRPRTRVLHPIWEFADGRLTGWVATDPSSPKARHLETNPFVSITYWDPSQDVATADCAAVWETSSDERRAGWERFAAAPEPVGYDPALMPAWTDPDAEAFGVVRLEPSSIRVFPGTMLLAGEGEVLDWHR